MVSSLLVRKSALLSSEGFAHGFFGRQGGVSPAPWESLNFSSASGDLPERVAENVRRAASELGVPADKVYCLSQVHGVVVRELSGDETRDEVLRSQGDATLSTTPGVACGVRSADCATLLIADKRTGAVCAVHAGWRGVVAGAALAGVEALVAKGSERGDLLVAVGPHIEVCCFEVGEDVAAELASCSSLGRAAIVSGADKPHVDLRRVLGTQLADAGVVSVEHVRGCTVCEPEALFSYRREGPVSGRLLAAIVAR